MPQDADIDAILKDAGHDLKAPAAKPESGGAIASPVASGSTWQEKAKAAGGLTGALETGLEYLDPTPVAKGALSSLTGLVEGVGEMTGLNKIPGIKDNWLDRAAHDWADDTTGESWGGWTPKRLLGGALPFMLGGEVMAGAKAESYLSSLLRPLMQQSRGAGGRMLPLTWGQTAARKAPGVARGAIENTLPGAAAGISQDPKHPYEGAAAGAITSGLTGLVPKAVPPVVGFAGRHPYWASHAIGLPSMAAFGIPGAVAYPLTIGGIKGSKIAGHWIATNAGKVIGYLPAGAQKIIPIAGEVGNRLARAVGGEAGGELSRTLNADDYTQPSENIVPEGYVPKKGGAPSGAPPGISIVNPPDASLIAGPR